MRRSRSDSLPVAAAPYGSPSILVISYGYISMLGSDGMTAATRYALLNANYIKARLEAHYPVLYAGDQEGTMTNLEGRVIRRRRAAAPEGVHDDLWVMKEVAERLGRGRYFSADPAEVFAELRRASAGGLADYSGITPERIDAEQGVFWPCPDTTADGGAPHPGTPRLFAESFPTPDGRAGFHRVEHTSRPRRPTPTTRTC